MYQVSFIEKVVEKLLNNTVPLSQQVLIIPSERAKLYIEKELWKKLKSTFIPPQIFTIDEFILQFSPFSKMDSIQSLFLLYEVHCQLFDKKKTSTFEDFLVWAPTLIQDFDEIDRFLVNTNDLFKNLKDVKNIEQWSFSDEHKLSENQKKYLEFWDKIPTYYTAFQIKCEEEKKALTGSIYKYVDNHLFELLDIFENSSFFFIGLNALSNAEVSIIKKLIALKKATFWVDADLYYIQNEKHEAGFFIRKLLAEFGTNILELCGNDLRTKKLNIEIISCSQNTGQIKVVSDILLEKNYSTSNDLLLLADEDLITPIFQNIPAELEKANITLGLPLRLSPIKSWLEIIIHIQEGFKKHRKKSIYYKDILNSWNHPFFQHFADEKEKQLLFEKEEKINKNNNIFLSLGSISINKKIDQLHQHLFTLWENNWIFALQQLRLINKLLFENIPISNEIERASLFFFDKQVVSLLCSFEKNPISMDLDSFIFILQSIWNKQNISYYGNPTDGLQIMGLLETRMLNFERICIVGMNEGKLPTSSVMQTHIPMDLRHFFSLPTNREKQAVFAHHFYRLLPNCKELNITYFDGNEGYSQSEKSRYLIQLELELTKENPNIYLNYKDYTLENKNKENEKNSIIKDENYFLALDRFCSQGLSVSKLKKFFTCPLDFYYQVILGFGEQENVEEELENSSFGSLIHEVLEKLFTPHLGTFITPPVYDLMFELLPKELEKSYLNHFDNETEAFLQGKNYLSYQVSLELLSRYLKNEKNWLTKQKNQSLLIKDLEARLSHTLIIEVLGIEKEINIKGFVDRIDQVGDFIRIIDYKSGKIDKTDVNIENVNNNKIVDFCKKKKYGLQLLTYLFLLNKEKNLIADECNLYSLINPQYTHFTLNIDNYSYSELIELYPTILKELLEELYAPDQEIKHNASSTYCKYCN
ncbi:MAG: PD-(D/E)XK nuclease family protein [Flavobacteriia bacterium]|nr:PD-(D/E)XK nuclease family protein [Flavobacteriia bacterium]